MLKGNKGEWSEIYTLLKLLSEGNLYSGDTNLDKIQDLIYPIIRILRAETEGNYEYIFNKNIVIVSGNNEEIKIPVKLFQEQTEILLENIKSSKKGAFAIPEIEEFLKQIKCKTLKAKSSVKTDIRVVIHDLKTNTQPELGFSIKSQLGSPSTLLNASKATNFVYELSEKLTENQINEINSTKNFTDKFEKIESFGVKLKFIRTEKPIFNNNLTLIDSYLPEITANLMLLFFSSKTTSISELTENLRDFNPMNYDLSFHHNFYEYKLKHLLTDIALGLMPAKVWTGKYDATGGYLIVKEDGNVLAYHLYNRNEFENYLFHNTRLETASTKRHDFGHIYQENDKQMMKLNLQIRFKK